MMPSLIRTDPLLQRISETLGVPLETFSREADRIEGELSQAAELLRAFLQISDPEVRSRCLAFVREAAASSLSRAV